jgi:2-keto-4-pentenoate hydratase/2-oxohepta-3-ene-1,7-dioic acid hydratase in catechol pathway
MKLATFVGPGDTVLSGEVRQDRVVSFDDGSSVFDRLVSGDRTPADGESFELTRIRLLAPLKPRAVFAIGLNYLAHAAEGGKEGTPPEPMVFYKGPASVAPPCDAVRLPPGTNELDYEAELVVVIGNDNRVAGYAIADDVSARDWQRSDSQWWRAKGSDGFCPWGPWVTTAEDVPNPYDLAIRSWVNGEIRQTARTSELIFRAEKLIEFISASVKLEVGDLLLTGTPAGVGAVMAPPTFLRPGDTVRMEIEGLGAIEHRIV